MMFHTCESQLGGYCRGCDSDMRPLDPTERAALESFQRTMQEEVIPQVVEDIAERERLAQESRKRFIT